MFGQKRSGGSEGTSLRAFAPINRIEAYWQGLRDGTAGGLGLPTRSEIDPRGIGHDLRHAFVLERIGPDLCRIRVSGSVLSEVMGCEARGLPFSRAFDTASQASLAQVVEAVFRGPATARLTLRTARRGLHPGGIGEIRLLPLVDRDGAVSRLLGAIAFAGRVSPVAQAVTLSGSFGRTLRFDPHAGQMRETQVPYLRLVATEA
ncbi:PAS domain-containing protein [Shimia sp. FJ5]|uniref:PAS domain-containing protein n=1 Tax=Shimia sp. FJ5 TaxID=3079054 RepID=UPI002619E58D|nr:PAS domain-containing protein [Shimia sp. FJ5]MDV4144245.1 PAS domain-containing protein [Shimia sp. FJ5]